MNSHNEQARHHRFRRAVCLVVLAFGLGAVPSAGAAGKPGFFTSQPAMLTATAAGGAVQPIISVGDTLSSGYRFETIPDGIGILPNGKGTVDVFVNHETSLVPFPLATNIANCTTTTCLSDFDNAQVSRLKLHQKSGGVLAGELAITSASNYQRFCSAFLADDSVGFRRPILFTNEEATDFVSLPPAQAWPADPSNQRQAGLVVALDAKNGKTYEIPGMGRMNHENSIIVPGGWNKIVAVTGDDTFSAPASQLYMYMANSDTDVLADKGMLYAFRVTRTATGPVNPADAFNGANDYGDIVVGDSWGGQFIPVPREIAVGDQAGLENWSNANNVFQFIRVEDLDYDKNNPRIVYFADTGEPRALANPATGRLRRGPSGTLGPYPNGRIFKMEFNANAPTVVDSFSILVNADLGGYNNFGVIHNPDNVGASANSLMITEDPGGHNNYSAGTPGAPTAGVWRYDLASGGLSVAAAVDQSADPLARLGSWEASGIIDASAIFGPGTWLVNVQAHSIFVETATRTITVGGVTSGPVLFKREAGQMLLLTVPGS
ncbi:MAG: PhoX family protein [Chloroflexota bacterium]|nr:PhoX family protein [Chloroflexota bacterium]